MSKYVNAHEANPPLPGISYSLAAGDEKPGTGKRIEGQGDLHIRSDFTLTHCRKYDDPFNESRWAKGGSYAGIQFRDAEHVKWFAEELLKWAEVQINADKLEFYIHPRVESIGHYTISSWRDFVQAVHAGNVESMGVALGQHLNFWGHDPKQPDASKIEHVRSSAVAGEFWQNLSNRWKAGKITPNEMEAARHSAFVYIGSRF